MRDQNVVDFAAGSLDAGTDRIPAIGNDVADPAGTRRPTTPPHWRRCVSLQDGVGELEPVFGDVTCPLLLMTCPQDHVVPPTNSDALAAAVAGPVERLSLQRSFHVATIDFDKRAHRRAGGGVRPQGDRRQLRPAPRRRPGGPDGGGHGGRSGVPPMPGPAAVPHVAGHERPAQNPHDAPPGSGAPDVPRSRLRPGRLRPAGGYPQSGYPPDVTGRAVTSRAGTRPVVAPAAVGGRPARAGSNTLIIAISPCWR